MINLFNFNLFICLSSLILCKSFTTPCIPSLSFSLFLKLLLQMRETNSDTSACSELQIVHFLNGREFDEKTVLMNEMVNQPQKVVQSFLPPAKQTQNQRKRNKNKPLLSPSSSLLVPPPTLLSPSWSLLVPPPTRRPGEEKKVKNSQTNCHLVNSLLHMKTRRFLKKKRRLRKLKDKRRQPSIFPDIFCIHFELPNIPQLIHFYLSNFCLLLSAEATPCSLEHCFVQPPANKSNSTVSSK